VFKKSPGGKCMTTNDSTEIPNKVGMASSKRRTMNGITRAASVSTHDSFRVPRSAFRVSFARSGFAIRGLRVRLSLSAREEKYVPTAPSHGEIAAK
jgi:hypothetical protein